MIVNKLGLLRFLSIVFWGLLGAYIGNLSSYVLVYYLFPLMRIDNELNVKYISSIQHIIGFIVFSMLVYSPGLAIAWAVRRPSLLRGLTAPLLTFVYFLLVFFLGRFNLFLGSFGGFVSFLFNIIISTLICVVLFGLQKKGG